MSEKENGNTPDPMPTNAPPLLKKISLWLLAAAAILGALATTIEGGERVTKAISTLWNSATGSPSQNLAHDTPVSSPTTASSDNLPTTSTKGDFNILVGEWIHDATGTSIEVKVDGDILDGRFGRGRISKTVEHGANYVFNFEGFSCYYYISFTDGGNRIYLKLIYGTAISRCLSGVFVRAL